MSTKKKPRPPQPPRAIPFISLFGREGAERNARMAVRDPTTPPELRAELKRYLANPFHAAAIDQEKLLDVSEQRTVEAEQQAAPYRNGSTVGRKNKATEAVRVHIRELVAKYPKLASSPPQLFKKADSTIIGDMAPKTFADHVRALRKK